MTKPILPFLAGALIGIGAGAAGMGSLAAGGISVGTVAGVGGTTGCSGAGGVGAIGVGFGF